MKIALTGTPGTGKTEVSKVLSKSGYDIIDLNKLVLENKWDLGFDEDYQSTVADLKKLNAHIEAYADDDEAHFLEGHLSHFLNVELAVVLRTHPKTLEKRLTEREFPEEKIKENVEAEALAVITTEALARLDKVYEIDTTDISIEEAADIIEKIITDPAFAEDYLPGKFNWLEEIV